MSAPDNSSHASTGNYVSNCPSNQPLSLHGGSTEKGRRMVSNLPLINRAFPDLSASCPKQSSMEPGRLPTAGNMQAGRIPVKYHILMDLRTRTHSISRTRSLLRGIAPAQAFSSGHAHRRPEPPGSLYCPQTPARNSETSNRGRPGASCRAKQRRWPSTERGSKPSDGAYG
jgi:hypothetical protein